jgi:hypothetical protein
MFECRLVSVPLENLSVVVMLPLPGGARLLMPVAFAIQRCELFHPLCSRLQAEKPRKTLSCELQVC